MDPDKVNIHTELAFNRETAMNMKKETQKNQSEYDSNGVKTGEMTKLEQFLSLS